MSLTDGIRESIEACRRCGHFGLLGSGLCVNCWDGPNSSPPRSSPRLDKTPKQRRKKKGDKNYG